MSLSQNPQTAVTDFAQLPGVAEQAGRSNSMVNTAGASVPFGVLVCDGAAEGDCVLAAASSVPAGVVQYDLSYQKDLNLDDTGIMDGTLLTVLRDGQVWVPLDETVAAGDAVRVRITAAGAGKGTFRTTSAGAGLSSVLSNAKYIRGGSAGGVALLEVDLAGATLTDD